MKVIHWLFFIVVIPFTCAILTGGTPFGWFTSVDPLVFNLGGVVFNAIVCLLSVSCYYGVKGD